MFDLLHPAISHHSDWSVITAHNLTPVKCDDLNAARICLSHAHPMHHAEHTVDHRHEISSFHRSPECIMSHYTIRYDTIDDLHWKTDRQAASFI